MHSVDCCVPGLECAKGGREDCSRCGQPLCQKGSSWQGQGCCCRQEGVTKEEAEAQAGSLTRLGHFTHSSRAMFGAAADMSSLPAKDTAAGKGKAAPARKAPPKKKQRRKQAA